ncbi:gustatory receptor 45 [Tribolium castaneum]|nr:gustatory receptor 45 [Tribolium castaneum]CAL23168.2 gustatory receptor candidate 35 [Tribolium castaneum]
MRLKWYYITISMAFIIFVSLEIYHIYTVVEESGFENFVKTYLVSDFENYVTFFCSLFIVVILKLILAKYRQQDVTLLQITKAKNLLYSKQIVTILKKTKSNIFILKESVDTFNDIFGWIILCNIFEAAAKSLIYIDMIIKKNVTQQNSDVFIFDNVWLFILWVGILSTIFLCDTILKKVDDILSQAYKLEASFDDLATYETDEVQIFIDVVQHNRPEFKAARFFSIDRSTLFSVLNSLTTFLLVMIQFKEN